MWATALTLAGRLISLIDSRSVRARNIALKYAELDAERKRAQGGIAIAEQGRWFTALHRSLFIYPTGIYYGAIVADSLFRFEWNVAALPPPYDAWGFAVVSALFLVDGARSVARTIWPIRNNTT